LLHTLIGEFLDGFVLRRSGTCDEPEGASTPGLVATIGDLVILRGIGMVPTASPRPATTGSPDFFLPVPVTPNRRLSDLPDSRWPHNPNRKMFHRNANDSAFVSGNTLAINDLRRRTLQC
jgi:hypothetical protein